MTLLLQNLFNNLDSIEVFVSDYFSFILGMLIEDGTRKLKFAGPQKNKLLLCRNISSK